MQKDVRGFLIAPDFKETDISLQECLEQYVSQKESDNFFIYGERLYNENSEKMQRAPAKYHLFDFKGEKNLRGLHMTIETCPWVKGFSSKAIKLSLNENFGLSLVGRILHRKPKDIASAILKVESKIVPPNNGERPLFSVRTDCLTYYYGLIFELDKMLNK